jgi:subtilisin family serine protease
MQDSIRTPWLAVAWLCCLSACTDGGGQVGAGEALESARAELGRELSTKSEVDVIVHFRDPLPHFEYEARDERRRRLASIRESLLASRHRGFIVTRTFEHVAAVAGRIDRVALEALLSDPLVSDVRLDGRGSGSLGVAVPAVGGDRAQVDHRVTGNGIRVAVLDTGINATHADLAASVSSNQHCFTQNACPPLGSREGTSAIDDHGHGSHVAGIITSDGRVAGRGFAPDSEIVPVKVNDENSAGLVSDWVAGLDWLYSNLSTSNVKLVNMSIGTDRLYGSVEACDAGEPALVQALSQLVEAGVTLFASSGNRGSSSQMSAPACNSGVIAVGATYKSAQGRQPASGTYASRWGSSFGDCADATTELDQVTCFTNSGSRLDMVAPGAVIASDTLGSGTEEYRGTSQASPAALGVAALMLECNPNLSPAAIKTVLLETGVSVTDPKNGLAYPSMRADRAVDAACPLGGAGGAAGSAGGLAGGGLGGRSGAGGVGGSLDGGRPAGGAGSDGGAGAGGTSPNAGSGGGPGGTGGITGAGAGGTTTSGGAAPIGGTGGLTGGSPAGGTAGAGDAPGNAASGGTVLVDDTDGEQASCACRAGPSRGDSPLSALAAAIIAAVGFRRRAQRSRRRTSDCCTPRSLVKKRP